jgi:hypothetical protein
MNVALDTLADERSVTLHELEILIRITENPKHAQPWRGFWPNFGEVFYRKNRSYIQFPRKLSDETVLQE